MKILFMMFNDWLIKQAGWLLMLAGIIGHIINYNFDRIVGRSKLYYGWGCLNWWAFNGCWFLIYVGWLSWRYYKDWDKDIEEGDYGKRG